MMLSDLCPTCPSLVFLVFYELPILMKKFVTDRPWLFGTFLILGENVSKYKIQNQQNTVLLSRKKSAIV